MLGSEGRGYALGLATLDRLRPTVAAAACGMATRALADFRAAFSDADARLPADLREWAHALR